MNCKNIIESVRKYYGITQEELAATAMMSLRTYQNKVRTPGAFTIAEITSIASKLHIRLEINDDGIQIFAPAFEGAKGTG